MRQIKTEGSTALASQLISAENKPWSRPFPRWRVPVGPLRAIGAWEGQVGRIHLGRRKGDYSNTNIYTYRERNREKKQDATYEGRHDPSVCGEPGTHRGLGQRQGRAACRRVSRWPMVLGVWRGDPSCPIHHQNPTSATLHCPLPRQGGRQGSAPTVPPTCNVWKCQTQRTE